MSVVQPSDFFVMPAITLGYTLGGSPMSVR